MTLAILILGLVVATCVIAYLADNLGKNLGKKRISILGLRPRQTATLISMASSVGIMLLTLVILLITSKSLSNALLNYDAARRDINNLRRERTRLLADKENLLRDLSTQRKVLQDQIARNRSQTERFLAQRREAEAQLRVVSARLAQVREREAASRRSEQRARARLATAQRRFESLRAQLSRAQAQVAGAQARVTRAQAELQREQRLVAQARSQLKNARGDLTAAQTELTLAQERQREASTRLASANAELSEARRNLQPLQEAIRKNLKQLETAETEIAGLQVRRDELQTELETRSRELEELKVQTLQFAAIAQRIGTGDIAFQLGEVFSDTTIPAGVSAGQARQALRELMVAGRNALDAGKLDTTRRALSLVMPPAASKLSEDEFLDGLAAYLSTLGVPVSMRLVAARDHARGETEIFARLLPVAVRVVFNKDEVLGSARIDGGGSDARIFNQLLALLNETEKRARDRDVLPLPTAQNPLFYATGTNERIFEALRAIRAQGGGAQVQLIAAEDITTVDPLRIRFEISP